VVFFTSQGRKMLVRRNIDLAKLPERMLTIKLPFPV
jgi:hypothetical protein